MKVVRLEKRRRQLDGAEADLRHSLMELLPEAVITGSNLFSTADYNPSDLPAHLFHPESERLLQLARDSVRLREELGFEVVQSPGWLFLAACEENASQNEQRRGPRRLAESLLSQLAKDL